MKGLYCGTQGAQWLPAASRVRAGKVPSMSLVHRRHLINTALPGPQRMMAEEPTWDVGRDLKGCLAQVPESEMGKEKGTNGEWGRRRKDYSCLPSHYSGAPPAVLNLRRKQNISLLFLIVQVSHGKGLFSKTQPPRDKVDARHRGWGVSNADGPTCRPRLG